jgi:hypothetical protein
MEGGCELMSNCDKSCLLNGGEEMGMTDTQFKSFVITQLTNWNEVLELVSNTGDTEAVKKVEAQIAALNEMLKI